MQVRIRGLEFWAHGLFGNSLMKGFQMEQFTFLREDPGMPCIMCAVLCKGKNLHAIFRVQEAVASGEGFEGHDSDRLHKLVCKVWSSQHSNIVNRPGEHLNLLIRSKSCGLLNSNPNPWTLNQAPCQEPVILPGYKPGHTPKDGSRRN